MIFRQSAELVLKRKKWQTRRPVKPGQKLRHVGRHRFIFDTRRGRNLYSVGRDYAVQPGRGKPSLGRIRIRDIRVEKVQDISFEDAKAEGFKTAGMTPYYSGFLRVWLTLYEGTAFAWGKNPPVFVIEFELIDRYDNAD